MSAEKFSALNRSGVGKTPSAMRNIASKARKSLFSIDQITHDVLNLQKEYIDLDTANPEKNYGFIQQPAISYEGIDISLFDEGYIISLLQKVHYILTPAFVADIPWLKNDTGACKRILLYILVVSEPLVNHHLLQYLST